MAGPNQPTIDATSGALSAAFDSGGLTHSDGQPGQLAPQVDDNYGQLDDSHGGFGSDPEHHPTEQQGAEGDQRQTRVPSYRLREATDRAEAAEAELAAIREALQAQRLQNSELIGYLQALTRIVQQQPTQQPQQQPQRQQPSALTDASMLIDNPTGFANSVMDVATNAAATVIEQHSQQQLRTMMRLKLDVSDTVAVARYGREMVKFATAAAKQAGLMQQMLAKPDPVGEAVKWFQGQAAQQRYGNDPEQIRLNVAKELLADPGFVEQIVAQATGRQPQPQPPGRQQQPVLPPPLSGGPRGNAAMPVRRQTTIEGLNAFFDERERQRMGVATAGGV